MCNTILYDTTAAIGDESFTGRRNAAVEPVAVEQEALEPVPLADVGQPVSPSCPARAVLWEGGLQERACWKQRHILTAAALSILLHLLAAAVLLALTATGTP